MAKADMITITTQKVNTKSNVKPSHFDVAYQAYNDVNYSKLQFGLEMIQAMDDEGRTLREMSIRICGNESMEDRLGRWVMAARWQTGLYGHPLYEDAMEWLSPTHFTEYYKVSQVDGTAAALSLMEETFIRTSTDKIVEVRPVEWVRGRSNKTEVSLVELRHRLWKLSAKLLSDYWGELERKGLQATKEDKRAVRLLKLVVEFFQAKAEK